MEPAVLGHDVGEFLVFFNAKRNRPGGLAAKQLGQPQRPAEFGLGRRPQGQRLGHNHKQDAAILRMIAMPPKLMMRPAALS